MPTTRRRPEGGRWEGLVRSRLEVLEDAEARAPRLSSLV
uniref:Uncharacterized protein n=1 Tax=Arundo donax TaxID=35708 RepID=A0A0A9EDE1_ARUDO